MQSEWLKHQLTDQEREAFDRDGYFLVENAISEETVARANAAVDRLIAIYRDQEGLEENARINYLDFIGRDREFMDLLDCPTTFPKVWNIGGGRMDCLPPAMRPNHAHGACPGGFCPDA